MLLYQWQICLITTAQERQSGHTKNQEKRLQSHHFKESIVVHKYMIAMGKSVIAGFC